MDHGLIDRLKRKHRSADWTMRRRAASRPFVAGFGLAGDELAGWNWGIWFSPAVTLGIGTTEVMKNVIAERMLEMPREDDPDVRKPWNETQPKGTAS